MAMKNERAEIVLKFLIAGRSITSPVRVGLDVFESGSQQAQAAALSASEKNHGSR